VYFLYSASAQLTVDLNISTDNQHLQGGTTNGGRSMMVRKHDLPHEFAQYRNRIHELKMTNEKFARLYKEYQRVDKEIVRI
jgi:hypothetical protein